MPEPAAPSIHIDFVLIREGSSDDGLVEHLERLCLAVGASSVAGEALDLARLPKPPGHSVRAKLEAVLRWSPASHVIFVHRDADEPGDEVRRKEILAAAESLARDAVIPVVPVQATESWLLLDEGEIRRVVGRPNGRVAPNLPHPAKIEQLHDPKGRLKQALETASGLSGRHLARIQRDFARNRAELLRSLDTAGPVQRCPAWIRLRDDCTALVLARRQASAAT